MRHGIVNIFIKVRFLTPRNQDLLYQNCTFSDIIFSDNYNIKSSLSTFVKSQTQYIGGILWQHNLICH